MILDSTGEVSDLLGMSKQDITLNIVPAALAKLTEARDNQALQALAANTGMDLPTFMQCFGHHAIAKFLYEGQNWLQVLLFKNLQNSTWSSAIL